MDGMGSHSVQDRPCFWLFLGGILGEMFSIERVSCAERNCKIVIFKRVLRLNVNEINKVETFFPARSYLYSVTKATRFLVQLREPLMSSEARCLWECRPLPPGTSPSFIAG